MENHSDRSVIDLTLRARYLRGAYLASLLRRALGLPGRIFTTTPPAYGRTKVALDRR